MRKLLLSLLIISSSYVLGENEGISFIKDSTLSGALAKAKLENKLLFIDCFTTWCGPCKFMEKNIFPMKEVGDFYNKHFVCWEINMETPEGRMVGKRYAVRAYPTYLFLDAKGEVVHRGLGSFRDYNSFITNLGEIAIDETKNFHGIKLKVRYGDRSAETLMKYIEANSYAKEKDSIINQHFALLADSDKVQIDSWNLFKQHVNSLDAPISKFFVENRKIYENAYGKKDVDNKLSNMFSFYYRSDTAKYKTLKSIDPVLFEKNKLYNEFQYNVWKLNSQLSKNNKEAWKKYTTAISSYLDREDDPSASDLNNMSWLIYENYKKYKDTEILKKASGWSKRSLLAEPENDQYFDTYAHILFDLGQKKEAIKLEEKALKKAEEMKDQHQIEWYGGEVKKFKGIK